MKRTMTLLAAAVLTAHAAHAQYVTYNHDSPKQNQITVMETGTGAFTPEIYYTLPSVLPRTAAKIQNNVICIFLGRQEKPLRLRTCCL